MSLFTTAGGGSTQLDDAYEISNSLRFNDSQYLEKTFGSAGNRKTFTISFWTKRCVLGNVDEEHIFSADSDTFIRFETTNDRFRFASNTSPNVNPIIETNRQFRDVSAWYHIVLRVDTTQASSSDRVKLYVNGSEETSFATDSRSSVSQNADMDITNNTQHTVGTRSASVTDSPYTGYLADFYLIDGQSLAPTEFGETNDNGVWIPKRFSGSYGTNGFKLEFQQTGTSANSSGMGADTSGNDHHFTPQSLTATDVTEDTPTNNFATANPLDVRQGATFADGNLQITTDNTNRNYVISTIGASSGKWYMECKVTAGADTVISWVGVADFDDLLASSASSLGDNSNEVGLASNGTYQKNNVNNSGWGGSYANDDIIGILLDMDNNRVTFHKNGSYADGAGNFDESSPTAYISLTNSTMGFAFGDGGGGSNAAYQLNFGNPPFTISSGNSDANGFGVFEYAVPSGYYSLCTKNLAEYG